MAELQIETYEIEECENAGDDINTEEYQQLHKTLNLEGQKKILTNDDGTGIPFQRMDKSVFNIWQAYCPGKFKLHQYRGSLIPLRVLGLLKICQEKKYFGRIEIWTESENNPDPIAVGVKSDYDWSFDNCYLIARWGESLDSWAKIVQGAKEKITLKLKTLLGSEIEKIQSILNNPDDAVNQCINGENPYFVNAQQLFDKSTK